MCKKIWKANQKASLCFQQDGVLVTSAQSTSTPGIKTCVSLHAGNKYILEVTGYGFETDQTKAFVWVYDPISKKRLIKNYTMLSYKNTGCNKVSCEFTPCRSGQFYLGVLFTEPKCAQRFVLNKMSLLKVTSCDRPRPCVVNPCEDDDSDCESDSDCDKCPDEDDDKPTPCNKTPKCETGCYTGCTTIGNLQENLKIILENFNCSRCGSSTCGGACH